MSAPDLGFTAIDSVNKFRWIVFDAVGTLIHPDPPVPVAYQTIAARHGSRYSVEEINQRFKKAFRQSESELFSDSDANGTPWVSSDAIETARWRWIVQQVVPDVTNHDAAFAELWDHFARPASWSSFPDVETGLERLNVAGIGLAIASNFDSRLHPVCEGLPSLRWITHRFVSSETGYRKPAPDFYRRVIHECRCNANEILWIGDDPEHDVSGPQAEGIQSILIDRRGSTTAPGAIRSLHELPF